MKSQAENPVDHTDTGSASQQRNALLDSVAQEVDDPTPPGEKPFIQGFESALTWLAYVAIVAVVLLMTWSVGTSITKYLVITR
jgi:hypothetical protein